MSEFKLFKTSSELSIFERFNLSRRKCINIDCFYPDVYQRYKDLDKDNLWEGFVDKTLYKNLCSLEVDSYIRSLKSIIYSDKFPDEINKKLRERTILIPVPAYSIRKHRERYKEFCEELSEKTGTINGYDCITVTGSIDKYYIEEYHYIIRAYDFSDFGYEIKAPTKNNNYKINFDVLNKYNEKYGACNIILLDLAMSSGETFNSLKNKILDVDNYKCEENKNFFIIGLARVKRYADLCYGKEYGDNLSVEKYGGALVCKNDNEYYFNVIVNKLQKKIIDGNIYARFWDSSKKDEECLFKKI